MKRKNQLDGIRWPMFLSGITSTLIQIQLMMIGGQAFMRHCVNQD